MGFLSLAAHGVVWFMEGFFHGLFGWFFFLSPNYRGETFTRWREIRWLESRAEAAGVILGTIASLVLISLFIGWLATRAGMNPTT